MSLLQLTEEFVRKLIDLAGNPHAKGELHSDVSKLVQDAKSTEADVVKEAQGSGQ